MHTLPRWLLPLALIAAGCTPSGGGSGSDCREADNACAGGFICAAIALDTYECRPPCNEGLCPVGERCDPFSNACVPGDAPAGDAGPMSDADQPLDGGAADADLQDAGSADGAVALDAAAVDAEAPVDGGPNLDARAFDAADDPDGFDPGDAIAARDGFEQVDGFWAPDGGFEPDAAQPLSLMEGDWRVEVFLASDNPVMMLLRLTVIDGRSPVLNAVRNYCDGEPCSNDSPRAWGPVDESTNDIEVVFEGDFMDLIVFGGLPLTSEASPYGEEMDLFELTLQGRMIGAGRVCGVAFVRFGVRDGDPFGLEGVPFRLEHVGEWQRRGPDADEIFGCEP